MKARIQCDGLCEPKNPGGHACWGYLLEVEGRDPVRASGLACSGAGATNNVAEYHALGRALRAAIDAGADEVEALSDSKLVVEQVNGNWSCVAPKLVDLRRRIRGMADGLKLFTLAWVPRAQNAEADGLSREAYVCITGHQPPDRHRHPV